MIIPVETGACWLEERKMIMIPGGSQGQKLRLTMWYNGPMKLMKFKIFKF